VVTGALSDPKPGRRRRKLTYVLLALACSWTCAPCYLQHEQDVDNHRVPAKPKLERALKAAEQLAKVPSADKVLRTFRGWPMRYLGQYTRAEDAVGACDLLLVAILLPLSPCTRDD
jgi:hypothetical protein